MMYHFNLLIRRSWQPAPVRARGGEEVKRLHGRGASWGSKDKTELSGGGGGDVRMAEDWRRNSDEEGETIGST